MVDVSVIIVNYNTYDLTRNAVLSIRRYTKDCSYEVIVVDNGSASDPGQMLEEEFPGTTVIRSDENLGFAAGNNLGIRRAKGTYILLLNSDTELLNDALSISVNYLNKNEKTGVVTCRLEYPNGAVQNNCQRFPGSKYTLAEWLRIQKVLGKRLGGKLLLGSFFDYREVVFPDWVWGTFFFFRSELLKNLEGNQLNDDYFMYGEDMQWSWDIRKLGWQIAFLPEARVMHIMEGSKGEKKNWIRESYARFINNNYNWLGRTFTRWIDQRLR